MTKKINVKGREIVLLSQNKEDYISLTDIARYKDSKRTDYIIQNWMRMRSTIEFLGLWERLNNPNFKPIEFDGFRFRAGLNSFSLTPKCWIERINAIGIISRSGRNGGTYAHKDIAFEFASWISAEFKLYLIKEFQRLKVEENERKELGWDAKRFLVKANYKVHTDAVKENLIPKNISKKQAGNIYADEADVLNMSLFGMTAKEWRGEKSKIERQYARLCECDSTGLSRRTGKSKCGVYPARTFSVRKAIETQSNSDYSDEITVGHSKGKNDKKSK